MRMQYYLTDEHSTVRFLGGLGQHVNPQVGDSRMFAIA